MPCRQDLSDATAQMSDLFKRVKDIQQKAADSEVLVQEICRDIRKVLAGFSPVACCPDLHTAHKCQQQMFANDAIRSQHAYSGRHSTMFCKIRLISSWSFGHVACCFCQQLYAVVPGHWRLTCACVCIWVCLLQLDYAKRHLTHTITSLRRLAMLTAAVDDLEQVLLDGG